MAKKSPGGSTQSPKVLKSSNGARKQLSARSRTDIKSLDDSEAFTQELQGGSDRAAALIAASFLDTYLLSIFEALFYFRNEQDRKKLLSDANAPVSSMSARARLAFAMEIIDEQTFELIETIRYVRNAFAHSVTHMNFQTAEVHKICMALPRTPDLTWPDQPLPVEARMRYIGSCLVLSKALSKARADIIAQQSEAPPG